jgi:hypothetical protein
MNISSSKKGFVLLYTLLIISVSLVLVISIVDSSLNEIRFSGDEARSLAAFYAADTAIECVRYWQNTTANSSNTAVYPFPAFDTRSAVATYPCGFGNPPDESFTAGQSSVPACVASTVNFTLDAFDPGSNAPCANVQVTTIPHPSGGCNLSIIAHGKNDCRPGASNVVERTRWETWVL